MKSRKLKDQSDNIAVLTEDITSSTMPHKWAALVFLALSVSIIVIDGTIINVSLPVIMKALSLNFTQIEWITTIYSLIFSALLITTGRIADHIGRRFMLVLGIATFVVGSIFASMSTSIAPMLIARSIQGLGGAIVLPTTLSTVNSTFFGKDRIIAFAVWGSVISGTAALGPLLGGYLTTYFDWRWVFLINIPIGIAIIIGALLFIPKTYGEKMKGFDIFGFILSTLGLASLVFALIEGRNYGWIKATEGSHELFGFSIIPWLIALGVASLILFVVVEKMRLKEQKTVLLDVSLFGLKSFSAGNIIACIVAIGEFGLLFVLPLYLQNILNFTPLKAGEILAAMGLGAFIAGGFASEIGRRTYPALVASIGLFLESVGMIGFFFMVSPGISTGTIIFWLVVYGVGLGMASAQLTSTVLMDVPPEKSGQGSATQSTVRQVGSVLGVAIVGTILVSFLSVDMTASFEKAEIPSAVSSGLEQSIVSSAGGSISAIKQDPQLDKYPPEVKEKLVSSIEDGFTESAAKTIGISGLIVFVGFLLTFMLPKKKREFVDTKPKSLLKDN